MRKISGQKLRDGFLAAVVVWVGLFGFSLAKTIYQDHQAAADTIADTNQNLDSARKKEKLQGQHMVALQSEVASLKSQLASVAPTYPRLIGAVNVMNMISSVGALSSALSPGTAVLVTSDDPRNAAIRDSLIRILGSAWMYNKTKPLKLEALPDYRKYLDAPTLPKSAKSGVIVHAAEGVLRSLRTKTSLINLLHCFTVKYTHEVPRGLAAFYKANHVLWIEIGSGSPWRQRCYE